jgi:uncharacterized protein (TIGR04255 family)
MQLLVYSAGESMSTTPIPSYTTPPLTEVVCGVQFDTLPLQTRHLGQFWTEVSNEYPLTQDLPPVPEFGDFPSVNILVMPPLRRTFMATSSTEYAIQIQENRLHYNWRKLNPELTYPRFPTVFHRFLESWGLFSDFVRRQGLAEPRPKRYELTYVNELNSLGTLSVEQAIKLFDWEQIEAEFLPKPQGTNIAWSFSLPEQKGTMNVSTNRFTKPDGRATVVLTLQCSGPSTAENYSLNEWFDTAHEWIVRGFTDLTTLQAQRIWKREA